jgi:uncharacterized protein YbaA (DUF1428 family)
MSYVDGFVLAVPKKKVPVYRRIAQKAGRIWKGYGAVEYRECAADDLNPKMGAAFPRAVKLKRGETVFFSWIVYKSKRDRDRVNAKVMKDPWITKMMAPGAMPFDVKRMGMAGFKVVVDM